MPVKLNVTRAGVQSAVALTLASHEARQSAFTIGGITRPVQRGAVHMALHMPRHSPMHCALAIATHWPVHEPVQPAEQLPSHVPMHAPLQLPSAARVVQVPMQRP